MTEHRVQYSEFIGDGQVVFRVDSIEELKSEWKLLAEASGEIATAAGAVKTAHGVTKAAESKPPQRRSYQKAQNSGGSTGGGSTASDVSCEHGKPYNDVRGKTYQSGAKQGQAYAYELYASCGDRSCKPRNY